MTVDELIEWLKAAKDENPLVGDYCLYVREPNTGVLDEVQVVNNRIDLVVWE